METWKKLSTLLKTQHNKVELSPVSLRAKAIDFRNRTLWLLSDNQPSFLFAKAVETGPDLIKLLTKINKDKPECFFISPHLDDVVLSAGSLIHHLSGVSKVVVATVFTETDPNLISTKWTKKCGFKNPEELVKTRKQEDVEALKYLGVDIRNIHHLGYTDVECRTDNNDAFWVQHVYNTVLNLISKSENPVIFFPAADTRKNKDHKLLREVSDNFPPENTVLWKEFIISKNALTNPDSEFQPWRGDLQLKAAAICKYESQLKAIFPIPQIFIPTEGYLFKPEILQEKQEEVITSNNKIEISID